MKSRNGAVERRNEGKKMQKPGAKVKSGIRIEDGATGAMKDLTFSDLAEIAEGMVVNPDLFLDIQSEMLGEVFDGSSFQKVRKHFIEALTGAKYADALNGLSDAEIELLVLVITLRLQAADELSGRAWMQSIWIEGMGHDHVLPALGRYFTTAPLVYSSALGGLIFDEATAREALHHLADNK